MLTEIVLGCDGKKPQAVEFEKLFDYKGKKNLKKLKSLSAKADTRDMSLSFLGDIFPNLQQLRLNNSIVASCRDISTELSQLRILSLANCRLSSLDGICTISCKLQELYLADNHIGDLSELIGLANLKVLDLENNDILLVEDIEIVNCCKLLRHLTLRGNPCCDNPDYRSEIKRYLPKLLYLDEVKFGEEDKQEEQPPPTEDNQIPDNEQVPAVPQSAIDSVRDVTVITEYVVDKVDKRPTSTLGMGKNGDAAVALTLRPRQTIIAGKPTKIVQPKVRQKIWHNVGAIRL